MKKLPILLVLCAAGLWAQAQSRSFTVTVAAPGATAAVWTQSNFHTLQVIVNGSPSACTVRLDGSLDNVNWFDISGSQSCMSSVMFHVDGKPLTFVRANLLTWTGGTNAVISYQGAN